MKKILKKETKGHQRSKVTKNINHIESEKRQFQNSG